MERKIVVLLACLALACGGSPGTMAGSDAGTLGDSDGGWLSVDDGGPGDPGTDAGPLDQPDASPPRPTHALTLTFDGWGQGTLTVAGHPPCATECTLAIPEGDAVTIVATPGRGQELADWSGECAGTTGDACTLSLEADRTAGVFFTGGHPLSAGALGGTGTQNIDDVAVADDGDLIVVGRFDGPMAAGGTTEVVYGASDAFVARFAPDASSIRWLVRTRGGGAETLSSVALGAAGEAYVVGTFEGQLVMGGEVMAASDADPWAARIEADGTVAWVVRLPVSEVAYDEECTDVMVGEDGNVYAAGRIRAVATWSDVAFFTIAPTDGSATVTTVAGGGNEATYRIAPAPGGDLYLAGRFDGTLPATGGVEGVGQADVFLLRVSPLGAIAWVRSIGGTGYDEPFALASDDAGNVYVGGTWEASVQFPGRPSPTTASGSSDWFLVSWAQDGVARWSRTGGGAGWDEITSLAIGPGNGDLYITGSAQGPAATPVASISDTGSVRYFARMGSSGSGGRFQRSIPTSGMAYLGGVAVDDEVVIGIGSFSGTSRLGMGPDAPELTATSYDGMLIVLGR